MQKCVGLFVFILASAWAMLFIISNDSEAKFCFNRFPKEEEFNYPTLNKSENLCGCPKGSYLTTYERRVRTFLLHSWCDWLSEEHGFLRTKREPERMPFQKNRTWLFYEDPRWPKPPHCSQPEVLHIGERGDNTACAKKFAAYKTFVPGYNLEIYHPSKTGSSSVIKYVRTLTHSISTDYCYGKNAETPLGTVNLLTTRPPVERFISAVGEILTRKCPKTTWESQESAKICWDNYGLNVSNYTYGSNESTALLECFIRESECSPFYCASEHEFSQGFFVSRGGSRNDTSEEGDGPDISALLPAQNLSHLLPAFLEKAVVSLNKNATFPTVSIANAVTSKSEDIRLELSKLKLLLHSSSSSKKYNELMPILCRKYMQDFVCLEEENMPEACRDMLEIAVKAQVTRGINMKEELKWLQRVGTAGHV